MVQFHFLLVEDAGLIPAWCPWAMLFVGVVSGIHTAIRKEQEERSQETSTALMVLNTKLSKAYKEYSQDFRTVDSSGSGPLNGDAYYAGSTVGKTLNLKLAVTRKIKGD